MIGNNRTKQLIIAGVTVTVIAAGSYGIYRATGKTEVAVNSHGGQQATGAAPTVSGDKVVLDAKGRQLAGVQTAQVEKRALMKEIRTTGKITVNESGRAYLTSWVMGRIDQLYVTSEGAYIAPGQAIASVYSADYLAAQEEYILALETVQKFRNMSQDITQTNYRLLAAAKRKLDLLGVTPDEIAHLEHTRKARTHMTVRAQFGGTVTEKLVLPGAYIMAGEKLFAVTDLSTVWLNADIYERDVAGIQLGQEVAVTTAAYPGQTFSGVISFISPVVDDATRTVKMRIELANPEGSLKPNMFANASVKVPLGETLVIPSSSLLDTGKRKVVFIAEGQDGFVKRDIVTGQETQGFVQVLSGLEAGDTVVTAAAFLIDSQTQLGNYNSHAGHGGSKQPASQPATTPQSSVPSSLNPSVPEANDHSGHSGH